MALIPGKTPATVNKLQTGAHFFADESKLAQGRWVRISVTETGVYQITDDELFKMGFSDPAKVGVFGFGGNILTEDFSKGHIDDLPEVPVYRDNAKSRILFFAKGLVSWERNSRQGGYVHTNNYYANNACYFLYQKSEAQKGMTEVSSYANYDLTCNEFDDYFVHEQDLENIGGTGREMYGESFIYTRSRNFAFNIPGVTSDDARIYVNFIAKNSKSSVLEGYLNGTSIFSGNVAMIGSDKYQFAQASTINTLISLNGRADNTLTLTYSPGTGVASLAMLNYIRLNVKRELQLYGTHTIFRNSITESRHARFVISGFNSTQMVWDVTTAHCPYMQQITDVDGTSGFVPAELGLREYVIVNKSSTFPSVISHGVVANQNLHALPQTDMVIVVAPKLISYANELAEYRRANDGLSVHVVTPQQIYNEFSSGTADATAIRLFMKMFYDRGQADGSTPKYLLLFGDGANDNRFKNSSAWTSSIRENMLITYQSQTSLNETESYVCDDYFGFLDDNEGGKTDNLGNLSLNSDYVDIGIGRLPVRNASEAKTVLTKILNYSNNTEVGKWKNQLVFLADDGDNNTHMRHADSMTMIVKNTGHKEFLSNKIYIDAFKRESSSSGYTYPAARKSFFDNLNQGAILVNYAGHGSTTALTGEKVFNINDAAELNMKRLPIWVTATCDFSRFDDVNTSAGETLILNPQGGAIAMFTTTRVVYSDGNLRINARLIQNIFSKNNDGTRNRLGDVMRLSKRALGSDSNKLNFVLLGDPSMTMAYPAHRMEITHINDEEVTQEPVMIKALSTVKMKGRVLELTGNGTATDFTGFVQPTVFDSEETITTLDNIGTGNPFVYKDRNKRLFSGRDSVINGEFEFSFIVPKDISYSNKSGMVNLYAYSNDKREAQGYYENITVGGTEDNIEEDNNGPEIKALYLNLETFKDGDVVNTTPYLYAYVEDETAINASGISIGHDITATFYGPDGTIKHTLNNYYMSETGSTGSGTIQFSVPELTPGEYTMELKVWDVHNNSSVRYISFVVKSDARPVLIDLTVSRNPAKDYARFLLYHSFPETNMSVRIQVYTQMGQCVWQNETKGSSEFMSSLPIEWDLTNSAGSRVQPGIYIYRASVSADGKNYVSKSKKLIVVKQ